MRRTLLLAVSLIILTGLAVGMIYKILRPKATADIARVEKDIREHLPVGTSRTEVEAYLDQKRLPHWYTGESKQLPEYQHTETAMIGGTSRTWLVRGDTQILFKFDNQDRLIDYKVQEIFTGP
jgi:hypothetical protein